jgi:hypothetical protein
LYQDFEKIHGVKLNNIITRIVFTKCKDTFLATLLAEEARKRRIADTSCQSRQKALDEREARLQLQAQVAEQKASMKQFCLSSHLQLEQLKPLPGSSLPDGVRATPQGDQRQQQWHFPCSC